MLYSGICELPVDPYKLRNSKKRWAIFNYLEKEDLLLELDLIKDSKKKLGFAFEIDPGNVIIFYDYKLSYAERRDVIIHEIGHIVLGHTALNGIVGKSDNPEIEDKQDKESNAFSSYVQAPTCILADAKIAEPILIQKLTSIPEEDVNKVLIDIMHLRNIELTFSETELCHRFKKYFHKQKLHIIKKKAIISVTSVFLLASALFIGYTMGSQDYPDETTPPLHMHTEAIPTDMLLAGTESATAETPHIIPTPGNTDLHTSTPLAESTAIAFRTMLPFMGYGIRQQHY